MTSTISIWLVACVVVFRCPRADVVCPAGSIYHPFRKANIAIQLKPVATGMAAPDYGISPPGDTSRLFVVEQNGLLRIIQNGTLVAGVGA